MAAVNEVMLAYANSTFRFGWAMEIPAREFGGQLSQAVRTATGLQSLQGLEMVLESSENGSMTKVTPRDIFEGRLGAAGVEPPCVRIVKSADTQAPAPIAQKGSVAAQPRPGPKSAVASTSSAPPRFQKKGGGLFQFLKIMEMDKDPAGLQGASNKRKIPMSEVQQHASIGDSWMVVKGRVFNITPYMDYHPGGKAELMKGVGRDATALFDEIHPWISLDMLERLQVGLLDKSLRLPSMSSIFRSPLKLASSSRGLPEALDPVKWRQFQLVNTRRITPDCVLMRFNIGSGKVSGLRPGQHLVVRLPAGTKSRYAETCEIHRPYTPTSDVKAIGFLELLVKVYQSGKMGPQLARMTAEAGNSVEMQGPFGDFHYSGDCVFRLSTAQEQVRTSRVVMFAAGSGITPMLQVIRSFMDDWRADRGPSVTLVFANRYQDDLIFQQDLRQLASDFGSNRFRLRLLLSKPPLEQTDTWNRRTSSPGDGCDIECIDGRVSSATMTEAIGPADELQDVLALICGPDGFNTTVFDGLTTLGLSAGQLHIF